MKSQRDMAYVGLMTALIVLCTWISIPTQPPFTLQTFAIFTAALCLGSGRAAVSVGVYLALGAMGLPVFAGWSGGIGHLLGPSGGFALGFLPATWIAGAIARRFPRRPSMGCIAGLAVCYLTGTLWYAYGFAQVSIGTAAMVCVVPFLLPDMIKIVLALTVARRLRRYSYSTSERQV